MHDLSRWDVRGFQLCRNVAKDQTHGFKTTMKRVLLYSLIALTRAFSDLPLLWMFYFLHFQKEGSGGVSDALFNAALFISFGALHTTFFIDYLDFLGIRALLRILKNRPVRSPVFSVRGPYAYCRHPLYLFLLLALWIGPIMTYGRLEFALLASLYLLVGTFLEERNLREELGEIYDLYRANVPMWIPRLKPWRPELT
jgi:protein-S-isoprenylcysteine O-methyltransferase Ste14